ncbi:FtsH protease activity modulator HflK [Fundidesulfovibrio terrae]|uniref:FtsH protease activity modulator HflK n=1 Tax=Fundidesulfovibrio terrae TaxID=2922866 RepID=UPI001FAF866E|nr:FtsH protease activity modulator HflK [Fundidesulfovibrio terrae]
MNWDWEKLQDKRQRQFGTGPDFKNLGDEFKRMTDFNFRIPGGPKVVAILVAVLWLASGIYIVEPGEVGVVKRFGAYDRTTGPGPHYHIPFPVESVQTPNISQIRNELIGFRSMGGKDSAAYQYKPVPEEALMLTGDDNIVDVQFVVQYQIGDPVEWLFRVQQPVTTVKAAAEAAMREVIGNKTIDTVLTTGKLEIQNTTKELLQSILDRYNSGVTVVAVQLQDVHAPKDVMEAFKDVASAMEDKNRVINEAEAYQNDILPKARGQAATMINDAQAYKESVVRKAKGEASRFLAVLAEYNKAKDVTRERIFIETMEEVFSNPDLEKIILSDDALKQAVPYLPLDRQGRVKTGDKGGK